MQDISAGIKKVYIAITLVVIARILGMLAGVPILGIIPRIMNMILLIIAVVMIVTGLYIASKNNEAFNSALCYVNVCVAIAVLGFILDYAFGIKWTGNIADFIALVLEMLVCIMIVNISTNMAMEDGNKDVETLGDVKRKKFLKMLKIMLILYAVLVILLFIGGIGGMLLQFCLKVAIYVIEIIVLLELQNFLSKAYK